jgi:serine/threonine-protein kinase HipA
MSDRQFYVYVDLNGEPVLVGRLWARVRKGRESASFEYDETWRKHPQKFALEPALVLGRGPQHTPAGREIFGAMGDSAPDRWGRVLIQREERRKARSDGRAPHTLFESDYVLAVSDLARLGALRFAEQEGGPYLASQANIPPLMELKELLGAAMRFDADDDSDADLKLLLAPGSSLGGARPKASIIDRDGHLTIAKFPKHDDMIPVSPW